VAVSVRSALAAQRAETVVEADGRLSASVTLPPSTYATSERRVAFYRELIARMSASAEVEQFALASALPLGGALGKPVTIEGHQGINGERAPLVDTVAISPGYFAAIGASLLRGRGFEPTDSAPGHEAAIVSQPFAEVYLPGVNPIGQRLRVTDEHASTTRSFVVVGVSPAVRQRGTGGRPDPVVYLPLEIVAPSTFSMIARTRSDPAKAAPLLRATVRDIDSDLPLDRVVALEQAMRDANWNPRLSTMLLLALTGIALGLSVIGLYAVTAHGVATRTREIGIRVALGARSREVITLVLLRAVRHIAYGFAAGIVCTIAWTRVFAATAAPGPGPDVYRLTDPGVVFGIAGVLALVAVLASVVPARRAVRVDPMVALRVE
jgi:putative ABC transport system permease protein